MTVLVYRAAPIFTQMLESLLAQTFKGMEVIVINRS